MAQFRVSVPAVEGDKPGKLKVGYGQSSQEVAVPSGAKSVPVTVPDGWDFSLKYGDQRQTFKADGSPLNPKSGGPFKVSAATKGE